MKSKKKENKCRKNVITICIPLFILCLFVSFFVCFPFINQLFCVLSLFYSFAVLSLYVNLIFAGFCYNFIPFFQRNFSSLHRQRGARTHTHSPTHTNTRAHTHATHFRQRLETDVLVVYWRDPRPQRWGKRETIPDALLSPPECFCIKNGQQCEPLLYNFIHCGGTRTHSDSAMHEPKLLKRRESQSWESNWHPSAYQPNALPLGQTGSQEWWLVVG